MGLFDFFKKKKEEKVEECCCCGEHHHEEEHCCCGEHHHHDEHCCCGEHHHHEEEHCCCGEHHHHDEHCCCGEHHHHDEECCCCGEHHHDEHCCCGEPVKGICCVKILGACCNTCTKQLEYVKEAVKNLGLDVPVTQVEDMVEIMDYGVLNLPAVVVNDKVVCKGKAVKTAEIEKILKSFL